MYAVLDGELFKREGLTLSTPRGTGWTSTGVVGVRDVAVNNFGVYVLMSDDSIIKKEVCPVFFWIHSEKTKSSCNFTKSKSKRGETFFD